MGHEILCTSIRLFRKVYPEFEPLLCYNQITGMILDYVQIDMYQQSEGDFAGRIKATDLNVNVPHGSCWKLCPPRLRTEAPELWIDNDVVITRRVKEIDDWLRSPTYPIMSEGLRQNRVYGFYESQVKDGVHANSGLFGLPPHFDFAKAIKERLPVAAGREIGGYDEQGLVAAVITNIPSWKLIPLESIWITEADAEPLPGCPGYHFVGANRVPHKGWEMFKTGLVL
jgi:hypothetical protein